MTAPTPDEAAPAAIAENLRALADSLPLARKTKDVLARAAELVELVDVQAADLARLEPVERRARDFLERPGISSAEAIATARYIVTGDPGA